MRSRGRGKELLAWYKVCRATSYFAAIRLSARLGVSQQSGDYFTDGLLPMRQLPVERCVELVTGKARVCRARGPRRISARCDVDDIGSWAANCATFGEDRASKSAPVDVAGTSEMVDAIGRICRAKPRGDVQDRAGKLQSTGRIAPLVRDNGDAFALSRQA